MRFERLAVIEQAPQVLEPSGKFRTMWHCVCECGTKRIVGGNCLLRGQTKSCGCLHSETVSRRRFKHGMVRTPTFKSWSEMRNRCNNPNFKQFKDWGGRGITICPEWDTFLRFFSDMGERPSGTSLDRKDNSKGYSKENCQWSDKKTQNRNKRNNRVLTIDEESMCISAWSDRSGVMASTIIYRLNCGWETRSAVFEKGSTWKSKPAIAPAESAAYTPHSAKLDPARSAANP